MLPVYLVEKLAVVFVGTSVATASAVLGHYYAGPRTMFWNCYGMPGSPVIAFCRQNKTLGCSAMESGSRTSSENRGIRPDRCRVQRQGGGPTAFRHLEEPEPTLGQSDVVLGPSHVFVLPSSPGANADRRNLAPKSSKAEWWRELGEFVRSFTA